MSIDNKKYPRLAAGVEKKTIVVDDDGHYRLLDGKAFISKKLKTGDVRPVKLSNVGDEGLAESLLARIA